MLNGRFLRHRGSESHSMADISLLHNNAVDVESGTPSTSSSQSQSPEPSALFLETSIWPMIRSLTWLIHVAAVSITTIFISFSFAGFYWADEGDWGNIQSMGILSGQETQDALQFAAKMHEIILQSSLSAMTLHFMRRMLIGDGIPWGLLSGCYQAGAPVWLITRDFWANLCSMKWRNSFVAFSLCLVVIYSNTIGPFSAIVILPTLAFWPVKDPFNSTMSSYIRADEAAIFPELLNETYISNLTGEVRPTCQAFGQPWCPDGGMEEVRSILELFAKHNGKPEGEVKQQVTDVRRKLVSSTAHFSGAGAPMSIATTLHASIAELTAGFWNHVNSSEAGIREDRRTGRPRLIPNQHNIKAPIVQVQCSHYVLSQLLRDEDDPRFRTERMRQFSSYGRAEGDWYRSPDVSLTVPRSYYDSRNKSRDLGQYWRSSTRNLQMQTFEWVDAVSIFGENPSLAALVTVPILQRSDDPTRVPEQDSLVLPCMIDAHWAGASFHYDPMVNKLLPSNLTNFARIGEYWKGDGPSRDKLNTTKAYITSQWAGYLNHKDNETMFSAMETLLDEFILPHNEDHPTLWEFRTANYSKSANYGALHEDAAKGVATVISLALAEGMSRVIHREIFGVVLEELRNGSSKVLELYLQSEGGDKPPVMKDTSEVDGWYHIDWDVQRKGWGYGLQTPTVRAGVSVLLIHTALVVCYTVYIIRFRLGSKGWATSAWSSYGELLAMGLISQRPDNRNLLTSLVSGTGSRSTVTTTVAIRARGLPGDDKKTPQLEMGAGILGERLVKNRRYDWMS